jgi:nitrogen fixation protein FixH
VDGVNKYSAQAGTLNTTIALAAGTRRLTVQAKDSAGAVFKQTVYVTVSSSGGGGSCTASTISPSVTICTPANNSTVASPVAVKALTTDTAHPVSYVQAYVDGVAKVTQTGGTLNASIAMTSGAHRLTVQAKDSAGTIFKQTYNITVK